MKARELLAAAALAGLLAYGFKLNSRRYQADTSAIRAAAAQERIAAALEQLARRPAAAPPVIQPASCPPAVLQPTLTTSDTVYHFAP